MAKKALKRASWRTIARRAEKAAPPVARRLRKRAAAARRIERAAKKGGNRTVKSLAREAHKAGLAVQITSIPRSARASKGWETRRARAQLLADLATQGPGSEHLSSSPPTWAVRQGDTQGNAPGHGEIVGGQLAQLAEKLAHLARTKGGKDTIQRELMAFQMQAKHDGSAETDKNATKQLLDVQQRFDERVVCGFLAEVDHAQQHYRGLPPQMVWTLSSHTVVKIVDALNKAGYKATGKADRNMATG